MQIYDQLLQFPLFQGMSRDDLDQVAGHTRFGFLKCDSGQTVVSDGDRCLQLYLLLSGTLQCRTTADDYSYTVTEVLQPPFMLQPEAIVGYYQRYTHTFIADSECSFITIDKDELVQLSQQFLVFRLNLLNIFATMAQKQQRQPWRHSPQTLIERIARWLSRHCVYPAGAKVFHILMTQLAVEVGDSRLDVSRALNQMQHDGLLHLHRGRIEVPHMEHLLMLNTVSPAASVPRT